MDWSLVVGDMLMDMTKKVEDAGGQKPSVYKPTGRYRLLIGNPLSGLVMKKNDAK
jgi:hypothetical protein